MSLSSRAYLSNGDIADAIELPVTTPYFCICLEWDAVLSLALQIVVCAVALALC